MDTNGEEVTLTEHLPHTVNYCPDHFFHILFYE